MGIAWGNCDLRLRSYAKGRQNTRGKKNSQYH